MALAEEREEKLRGELAGAGDESALRLLLRAHADRERLTGEADTVRAAVGAARASTTRRWRRWPRPGRRPSGPRPSWRRRSGRTRRQGHRPGGGAAGAPGRRRALPGLRAVGAPGAGGAGRLGGGRGATAAGKAARAASEAAQAPVQERDAAARELDRVLLRPAPSTTSCAPGWPSWTASSPARPTPAALRRGAGRARPAAAARWRRRRRRSGPAGRRPAGPGRARRAPRSGCAAAWRDFDTTRDGLARFGPPAADRDDVAAAWTAWPAGPAREADRRRADRAGLAASVGRGRVGRDRGRGADRRASSPPPGCRPADDPVQAAAVAVERAEADLRRLTERREQAAELREQRAGHEREARVARALAGHLRANNFERWLLAEALDLLVDGASGILRELSHGQYDLVHDKGEFFVVDHHDAGLRRGGADPLRRGDVPGVAGPGAGAVRAARRDVHHAASLESIVLDEGFGTLDAATLDTVAATLESLAARGDRMVGVVTHVPALAERIPVRFEVRKDARTARVERTAWSARSAAQRAPQSRTAQPGDAVRLRRRVGSGVRGVVRGVRGRAGGAEQRPGRRRTWSCRRRTGGRSGARPGVRAPDVVLLVDGVRRIDASVWTAEDDGASYPGHRRLVRGRGGPLRPGARRGGAGRRPGRPGPVHRQPVARRTCVAGRIRYPVHRVGGTGELSKLPAAVQAPLTALEVAVSDAARDRR